MGCKKKFSAYNCRSKMFLLFKWVAQNIDIKRKQFAEQKKWSNIKILPSKQMHAANCCVKDPITWLHI